MVENSNSSSQEDRQPTVQERTAHRARLYSSFAACALESDTEDARLVLRLLRDELLSLATAIRELEPEELPLRDVLRRYETEPKAEYSLEEMMKILDASWERSHAC